MPSAVNNVKSKRGSRISSPHARASLSNAHNSLPSAGDSFVEPPLAAKPSYEDAPGGGAYGVMADMQPLGTLPNAKVKSRVKDASRRSTLGKNAGHMLPESLDTPEGTPGFEAPGSASLAPEGNSPPPLPPTADDENDEDFMPVAKKKKSAKSRASKGGTATPAAAATPTPAAATTKTSSAPAPASTSNAPRVRNAELQLLQDQAMDESRQKLAVIVEAAVKRSREVGNPSLGLALRFIYEESLINDSLFRLLEVILLQTATEKQRAEFRGHISRAKKIIKNGGGVIGKRASVKASVPPENTARPSIETSAPPPKQPKISLRVKPPRKPSHAHEEALETNGTMLQKEMSPRKRAGSEESESSLSSLTSIEDEDQMEVDEPPTQAVAPAQMNGFAAPTAQSNLTVNQPARNATLKRSSAESELPVDDRDENLQAKKQKYSETLAKNRWDSFESDVRERDARLPRPTIKIPANTNPLVQPPVKLAPNGQAGTATRAREGSIENGSPLSELSTTPVSRRGTPRRFDMPAGKTVKKKAKTKQSPEKKQIATHGAEPGSSGGRGSPIGYDDNETAPKHQRGLFSALLSDLDKRNPSTFVLPQDLRDYFEGVGMGKDGRFVSTVNNKTRSRAGYDEAPDLLKTKDAKGKAILCYQCGKSSAGKREIITCDYCQEHWHLDCLDPPRASAPTRTYDGRKIADWMCPLHVDHELARVDASRLVHSQRTIRMRRPRNARIVDTSLTRGFVNNGLIDIANDSSDEEEEFYDDETTEGIIFRLPEKGIKLDFIDKVKRTRYDPQKEYARRQMQSLLARERFASRSIVEQKAALNLAQFAQQVPDLDIDGDRVEALVGALIAEAPTHVVDKVMAADTAAMSEPLSNELSEYQKKELLTLQELIRRRLEGATGST